MTDPEAEAGVNAGVEAGDCSVALEAWPWWRQGAAEAAALQAALDRLTADPLGTLVAAGVKGVPAVSDACPVARWLQRETAMRVDVGATLAIAYKAGAPPVVSAPLPESVVALVRAFDRDEAWTAELRVRV